MKEFNILFTSAGRRVSLVRHFKKTLTEMNLPGEIFGADLQKNAPALFFADKSLIAPRVKDPAYVDFIHQVCRDNKISLVVPLIDTELHILAPEKERLAAEGTTLLLSSPETIEICFDKRSTYSFFKQHNIPTPEILDPSTILSSNDAAYPFLLKPADGSCSQGVSKITNKEELSFFYQYTPNAIIQEFLPGKEYTLDILADFQGKVRCVVPRLRMETRAGEISKGVTEKNKEIIEAGKKVVESLPGAVGCITVQCFLLPDNTIKFIEINPRFGGGIPLSLAAGADYPRWIIEMMLEKELPDFIESWKEDIVMLRYDDAVFVDRKAIT